MGVTTLTAPITLGYGRSGGYTGGYGMMGGYGAMGAYMILTVAIASLIFSAIFWYLYRIIGKPAGGTRAQEDSQPGHTKRKERNSSG